MNTLLRRAVLGASGVALAFAAAAYGYHWWTVGRYLESTDDAYVKADYTAVAPKVSGYIAEVAVGDNQQVERGQVLARIDDRDFRTALDRARADVATAEAALQSIDAQIVLQRSLIAQARADLTAANAANAFAQNDYKRYRDLLQRGYVTLQTTQRAEADLHEKRAALDHDRSGLVAAERQAEVLQTERVKAATQLERARAAARQAEIDLGYTTLRAPIAGTVGARALRVGQYVQAGTQLMALVPLKRVFVVANFKETQLARVREGQPVRIEVDGFAGQELRGRVDSIAPASGLEFALLPPDNATGNFTKIVQRVPVKIAHDPGSPLIGRLRPGMSVQPVVDTRRLDVPMPVRSLAATASPVE